MVPHGMILLYELFQLADERNAHEYRSCTAHPATACFPQSLPNLTRVPAAASASQVSSPASHGRFLLRSLILPRCCTVRARNLHFLKAEHALNRFGNVAADLPVLLLPHPNPFFCLTTSAQGVWCSHPRRKRGSSSRSGTRCSTMTARWPSSRVSS